MRKAAGFVSLLVVVLLVADPVSHAQGPGAPAVTGPPADATARVDAIFTTFAGSDSPGCAVGVARHGDTVLTRAYGMADLEHDQALTPDSVFEAGSVSKQFTAAAVLLLAQNRQLSLDDDVRKFVPEVPKYEWPITIRQLLTHTSGLRDWGELAAIGGWPRFSRTYTNAHVLEIVSRQKALNYQPGQAFSYTNSGYNLSAILVSRVTGEAFSDFTRHRIFEPLGMTHTQWRDDYARIVKGRAIAYAPSGEKQWRQMMPFENAYGNGGLLTTVGDLLAWNRNFVDKRVGGDRFVSQQLQPMRLNDGRAIGYGAGLYLTKWQGVSEISHGGVTAGYRAFLARYPEQDLSVAVLCNAANANASSMAHEVAAIYLGDVLETSRGPDEPGPAADGATTGSRTTTSAPVTRDRRATGYTVSPADLQAYVGRYQSDEAEAEFTAVVEGERLALRQRPDRVVTLEPVSRDVFACRLGKVTFRRSFRGRVQALAFSSSRVYELVFPRVGPASAKDQKSHSAPE